MISPIGYAGRLTAIFQTGSNIRDGLSLILEHRTAFASFMKPVGKTHQNSTQRIRDWQYLRLPSLVSSALSLMSLFCRSTLSQVNLNISLRLIPVQNAVATMGLVWEGKASISLLYSSNVSTESLEFVPFFRRFSTDLNTRKVSAPIFRLSNAHPSAHAAAFHPACGS